MKSHSHGSPDSLTFPLRLYYDYASTAIRYRTSTQRERRHQVPPHLTIDKGELGAAQPAAPHVPRERTIDAQRRRLLLA